MEKDSKLIYDEAVKLMNSSSLENLYNAIMQFESIQGYEDSAQKIAECNEKIEKIKADNKAKRVEQAKQDEIQKEENKQKSKKAKWIALLSLVAVIIVAVLCIIFVPKSNYNKGLQYLNEKDYYQAVKLLNDARGDDLDKYLKEAQGALYKETLESAKRDYTIDVYKAFCELGDYEKSEKYAKCYDAMQYLCGKSPSLSFNLSEISSEFIELYLKGVWQVDNCTGYGHEYDSMFNYHDNINNHNSEYYVFPGDDKVYTQELSKDVNDSFYYSVRFGYSAKDETRQKIVITRKNEDINLRDTRYEITFIDDKTFVAEDNSNCCEDTCRKIL